MPAIPKTASKINETHVQAQTESDIEHGNQFLPKKSDVALFEKQIPLQFLDFRFRKTGHQPYKIGRTAFAPH